MPVPQKIREALDKDPAAVAALPGIPATDACEGSAHHSPRPIVLHEVRLEDEGRVALLCGTCKDNLETLLALRARRSGTLPWPVRREFGNVIRALSESVRPDPR